MGYSYGYNAKTGRRSLSCDSCGAAEGKTRRVTCTERVTYADGKTLPYCSGPAYCPDCKANRGGSKAIHSSCADPARRSTAEYLDDAKRLGAGDSQICSRISSWHELVPEGYVGAIYRANDGTATNILVRAGSPDTVAKWLSDVVKPHPWLSKTKVVA